MIHLGLWFFEEAAQALNGVCRIRSFGAGHGASRASYLRFQHASRDSADVGNEFWIGGGALNQERDFYAGVFTAITGTAAS